MKGSTLVVPDDNERLWTGHFPCQSPWDSVVDRPPGGVNVPRDAPDWGHAHAGLEIKSSNRKEHVEGNLKQLADDAYNLFSDQDARRYLITLSLASSDLTIAYFDRAGLIYSKTLNTHEPRGAMAFVRVLAGIRVLVVVGIRPHDYHRLGREAMDPGQR